MPERTEKLLRLACLVLGALLLFQAARIVIRRNPVAHLQIPALPTLAEGQSAAGHTNQPAGQKQERGEKSTNAHSSVVAAKGATTNSGALVSKGGANGSGESSSEKLATNSPIAQAEAQPVSAPASSPAGDNVAKPGVAEAGMPAATNLATKVQHPAAHGTNQLAIHTSTNQDAGKAGSNLPPTNLTRAGANPTPHFPVNLPPGALAGRPGGPPGMAGPAREVPPEILARVDRVTDSEILGPIMHPLPLALLGIAGDVAFLRAPSGQTGLVKEGDKLGELKLLRIGVNRVLVEDEGQKKELMIFSGLGGESLLPNESKPSP